MMLSRIQRSLSLTALTGASRGYQQVTKNAVSDLASFIEKHKMAGYTLSDQEKQEFGDIAKRYRELQLESRREAERLLDRGGGGIDRFLFGEDSGLQDFFRETGYRFQDFYRGADNNQGFAGDLWAYIKPGVDWARSQYDVVMNQIYNGMD